MIALQGFPFDKQHSLLLNRFTDIEKFANLEETYVEPEIEPFKPKVGSCESRLFQAISQIPPIFRNTYVVGWPIRSAEINM
jgi:hypothetical protein